MNFVGNFFVPCSRLTCSSLRHLAVSVVSAALPREDRKALCELMDHSESVQQAVYNDCLKTNRKIRISNILHKMLTNKVVTKEDLEEEEYGKHRCCSGNISYEEQLLLMILNGLSHVVTSEPV